MGATGGTFGYGRTQAGPTGPTPFVYLDATYSGQSNVNATTKYLYNMISSNAAYFYQFNNTTPISGGAIQLAATASNYGFNNISLATVAGSNNWSETKEFWLRLPNTTAGSNGCILVEEGSQTPDGGWFDSQIEIAGGVLKCGIWNNSVFSFTLAASVSRGIWHQVVWRYNSANSNFDGFFDGVKVSGITSGRQNPAANGFPLFYHIGTATGTNLGSGAYMTGDIAIFKYWNRTLTDAEVQANWNATRGRFGV